MTKKLTSILFGFLLTLLLFACSAEETMTQSSTNQDVEKAKNWFESDLNTSNLKIVQYTKDIQWDKAIITNGEKGQIIEVPITLSDFVTTTNTRAKKLNDYHRLLFIKSDNKNYNCYDLQIYTSDSNFDNLDKNFNYYSIKDGFNGFITMYDPTKQIVTSQKFKEGKIPKPNLTAKEDAYETCTYLGWIYDDGRFEAIAELYCSGGGGGGAGGYTGGYGGTGSSGGATGGAPGNSTVSEAIAERITDDNLDPCPKEALATLKNATNCDIANILTKLGSNSVYNVVFQTQDPKRENDYAETIRTDKDIRFNYTINVSPNYTSATSLFRAASLLHELTHAFFMSLRDDYAASGNLAVFSEFPELFQAYCDKKYPPYPNQNIDAHHVEMANTYVNAIGSALQEFQTGIPVNYGSIPNQVYTDLAWGGLKDAPIYNKMFPLGSPDRERVEYRYACEQTGRIVGSGNPNAQTPIGKPCTIIVNPKP
jgi:hypothetical protein